MLRVCASAIVFILFTTFVQFAAAADTADTVVAAAADHAALRVRIHDYANLRDITLARAQQIVSRLYEAIGVRTNWLQSSRPLDDQNAAVDCGPTDLTIIVLTPEMASRRLVPDAVVGYAAVTRGEAGRVAFIIYGRVRDVARHADVDDMEVLGTVMAHELGHLLLPRESHSDGGLMRAHWAAADFRHLGALDLRFSLSQAEEIRRTIGVTGPLAPEALRATADEDKRVGLLATIVD